MKTLEAAAQWYVDLARGTEAMREAHRQWLHDDPRHAQAWGRVERLQAAFGQLDARVARPALQSSRAKRREVLKVLALLIGSSALLSIGARTDPWRKMMADYATGTGERLPVTLSDGSRIVLNTGTALNISFDENLRRVVLREGEVFIQTAPDPLARPFIVRTAFGDLRALGTRFLVRINPASARVSVLEHAVELRSPLPGSTPVRINAGQQLDFSSTVAGVPVPLAKGADAWRNNLLVVSDWRLGDVIAELSRYRAGHLGCDAGVAELRISGSFQLGDIDVVLDNLSAMLPIRLRRFTRFWAQVEAV
ncbi:FecR domain-containing protein [Pseudomonas sp. DCB_AW]|uniref:FecR domain-containing protein n=1 Tax=Pseudomonas sp. DCB_AW TaxID=2993596 RepID=UPI002248BB22|nr:FecR domain-containing protein [Pseudomonas sp. DCB_AW]MCX2688122.1 FecR domain-containing protein [Pseudomonas sp. DCB_AW]